MENKQIIEGNEALAESAIRAGCKLFFSYPITPASEILEYYASVMRSRPEEKVTVIQAETELAAFSMVVGAVSAGYRAMTATSAGGFSLGQETMSFMAAAQLSAVVVDVMRPGPGDGEILAAQGDYFQAVKGGGHADYNNIVLAPYSVQESCELIQEAFVLAEKYNNPVILLSDATLAKIKESVVLPGYVDVPDPESRPNAVRGCGKNAPHKVVTSGDGAIQWGQYGDMLQAKFRKMQENEERYETYCLEDADIVLVAYGSMARVCQSAVKLARKEGLKVGMIRPITLWPFPQKPFEGTQGKKFLVCELSAGQMVEDVKLTVENKRDVSFFGRLGGSTPSPKEVLAEIRKMG